MMAYLLSRRLVRQIDGSQDRTIGSHINAEEIVELLIYIRRNVRDTVLCIQ